MRITCLGKLIGLMAFGMVSGVHAAETDGKTVIVTGTVPDQASKEGILQRLRELYGKEQVVDRIETGNVVLPVNWNQNVQGLLNPKLKQVHDGELNVDGTTVNIKGEVANEFQRQDVASDIATRLNANYLVNTALRVVENKQTVLDSALKKRIIEFDTRSAVIKPSGKAILDELLVPLRSMSYRKLEVTGYTDSVGLRENNISLSQARAEAVKSYLTAKGINPETVETSGKGPDMPVAVNSTPEGRASNRRIEFKIVE